MDDLDISYRQREEIRKLSVLDQYKAIKKLRKETEKANENLGKQYAKMTMLAFIMMQIVPLIVKIKWILKKRYS